MQNFGIGLSGLNAAQAGLDIVGNNIANAATEGYHRQRVDLAPSSYGQTATLSVGAGVDVLGVTRMLDGLLEREIVRQESAYGQVSQELSTLSTIETTFGEFAEGSGLNATMDSFFDSLRSLAAHPLERVWRNQVVSAAQTLANEFRRLGTSLSSLEGQVILEAQNATDAVNALITQIAAMNGNIQAMEINLGQANNLRDHRDQLIAELAQLVGLEVQQREYGVVDVSIGGLPVIMGTLATGLEVDLQEDQSLGIFAAGSEGQALEIQGGRLGGLLALKNDLLGDLQGDLDTLVRTIIEQVNRYHVQGLGPEGPFTQLTGGIMDQTDLAAGGASVTDGTFYLRVTNTATGAVSRYAIDVNVSGPLPDTPASIAARIDAITGLNASIISSRLHLVADPDYAFDFLPAVLPEPGAASFTGASPPALSVSGIYTGSENQTFTFTVTGTGPVGNGSLQLDVTDQNGDLVTTVNVGAGYAAGDVIELPNGIKITLGLGDLNAGDSFEVQALATTDTSGFLAAAGMNTFFSGAAATQMRVRDDIADQPDRIATAFGGGLTDNAAALRLAGIREEAVPGLSGMTPNEYYHRTVANLAQQVALRQSRQDNIQAVMQNLQKQRSEVSSVNINDEAAQLLVLEKMFQAMAKYMGSLQTMLTTLMEMV